MAAMPVSALRNIFDMGFLLLDAPVRIRRDNSNWLEYRTREWTTRLSYDTGIRVKRAACSGAPKFATRRARSAPRRWTALPAIDRGKDPPMKAAKTTPNKKPAQIQIGAPRTGAGGMSLPFSPAIRAGDFVYVSGQVAFDANG